MKTREELENGIRDFYYHQAFRQEQMHNSKIIIHGTQVTFEVDRGILGIENITFRKCECGKEFIKI